MARLHRDINIVIIQLPNLGTLLEGITWHLNTLFKYVTRHNTKAAWVSTMEANHQPANRVQVKIVNTMWERSAPALAIVPLGSQSSLAVVTLVLGFVFLAVFLMNRGKLGLASSAAASVFLAFGAVFLVNAVRVYTG